MKPLPKSSPRVTVTAATLPCASTTVKCVVCAFSATAPTGSVMVMVGVTRFGLIEARHCAARSSERRSRIGTRANAGSPRYLSRSSAARRSASAMRWTAFGDDRSRPPRIFSIDPIISPPADGGATA